LYVAGSMSAKTGVAPAWRITLTVAMKVNEGTITSSPAPIPQACSTRKAPVVQLGAAGNLAVVSGTSGSRQRFPNWIFGMTRRPASLVVGWTTRDGSPRLLTFSRSPDFLAAVDGGEAPDGRRAASAEVLARRVPNRSVVYRFQLARPLVRRSRSNDPAVVSAAIPVEEEGVAP